MTQIDCIFVPEIVIVTFQIVRGKNKNQTSKLGKNKYWAFKYFSKMNYRPIWGKKSQSNEIYWKGFNGIKMDEACVSDVDYMDLNEVIDKVTCGKMIKRLKA